MKNKLGTRQLPTAELLLDGTEAVMVGEEGRGIANISSMLTITVIRGCDRFCMTDEHFEDFNVISIATVFKFPKRNMESIPACVVPPANNVNITQMAV